MVGRGGRIGRHAGHAGGERVGNGPGVLSRNSELVMACWIRRSGWHTVALTRAGFAINSRRR